ncbi:MAG: hypothetical protein AMXMBFR58_14890 [Phycisphaerae bacterium]|nr:hypothetical protein [Phycisphaerales bacterium]
MTWLNATVRGTGRLLPLIIAAGTAADAAAQDFGRALSFDGVDDQVTCSGNFDAAAFTLEAWIFVRDYGPAGYGGIVSWGRQQDAAYELGVFGLNGVPQLLLSLNLGRSGSYATLQSGMFVLNQWTHIAVTYDGQFVNFFRNGQFIDSRQVSVTITPAGTGAQFVIGNLFTGNDQIADLSLDEVRVWNVARSEAEIHCTVGRPLIGSHPGLLAAYGFNESSGQDAFDSSGNGRHGVLGLTGAPEASDPARVDSEAPATCFDVYSQPQSVTQCQGSRVVLEFGACGPDPLTYQWRFNGNNIAGSNQRVHVINVLDPSDEGVYDVVVTAPCGTMTSTPAVVSICRADFDCSGFLDTDDYDAFVAAFEAGNISADFDGTGFVDTDDFTAFVLAFEKGC